MGIMGVTDTMDVMMEASRRSMGGRIGRSGCRLGLRKSPEGNYDVDVLTFELVCLLNCVRSEVIRRMPSFVSLL